MPMLTWIYHSIELAGVNMRLEQGAIRELHWHKQASLPSSTHPSIHPRNKLLLTTTATGGMGLRPLRHHTHHLHRRRRTAFRRRRVPGRPVVFPSWRAT